MSDTFDRDDLEVSYVQGTNAAWRQLLSLALRELGYDGTEAEHTKWILERTAVVSTLRTVCREFGDNDWDDDLHLSDVIDKHLARYIEEQEDEDEPEQVSEQPPLPEVSNPVLRREDLRLQDTDSRPVELAKRLSTLLRTCREYMDTKSFGTWQAVTYAIEALGDIETATPCTDEDCQECSADDIVRGAEELEALRLKYAQLKKLYDTRMEVTQHALETHKAATRRAMNEESRLNKLVDSIRQRALESASVTSAELLSLLTDGVYP